MFSVKVISQAVSDGFRKIKVRVLGNTDVQEVRQSAPFGVDSTPVEGMVAIYSTTEKKGKPVIIGYMNKNLLAAKGETRIFSLGSNGDLATFIWLKSDGIIQLGGNADNAVRFSDLKDGFDELKSDFNAFVSTYNGHNHTGNGANPPAAQADPSTATIDAAKINEIKTL